MVSSATKLSRLSRNKTTGNVIILILISLGSIFFLNALGIFAPTIDKNPLFTGIFLSLFFSYLTDRKLRQPFFVETSRFLEELINRWYDVQQASIQIELIEPLQKTSSIKGALEQIDALCLNLEETLDQTVCEISIKSASIRNHNIRKELREIKKLVEETLQEAKRKRMNIEFLAKIRQILLNTINDQISRPLNEIEFDYLVYKLHKQSQITDNFLLKQVLDHILSQGEIIGKLNQDRSGNVILTVERSYEGEPIKNITWNIRNEKNCVICRYPIASQANSVECPSCHNSFHRNHLLEWLKIFNQCPMCHERLTLFSNPP